MTERLPSAMRHADFRRFLAARLFANVGAEMVTVAVGYQVYQLTRKPLDLGLIGLSQFLPFVVLVLPAGQAVDLVTLTLAVDALEAIHDNRDVLRDCVRDIGRMDPGAKVRNAKEL